MELTSVQTRISKKRAMLLGAMLFATSGVLYAQEEASTSHIGKAEFVKNCAVCHGANGKGEGPILDFLSQKPADLTLISDRNGGVYPLAKMYEIIRDPQRLRAHGTEEMPIWGERLSKEIIDMYGPADTNPCHSVQGRILELVFYIGTLQE